MSTPPPNGNPWHYGFCDALFNRPSYCPWKGPRWVRRQLLYAAGFAAGLRSAFATSACPPVRHGREVVTSDKLDISAAFPCTNETQHQGDVTLRDYFAARAMQGYWASQDGEGLGIFISTVTADKLEHRAALFYRMADAMLIARVA